MNRRESMDDKSFAASLKSLDTEEGFDLLFYRPLGYRVALFCRKIRVTPNQVTVASIVLGIAGGVCFAFPGLWPVAVGALLIVSANLLDSVDGQLARLTGQYSMLGRVLDGLAGDCWFVAIYTGLALRLMQQGWEAWGFVLAAIAGFFHIRQAATADYYRNIHLYMLNAPGKSELTSARIIARQGQALSWRRQFFAKLTHTLYERYTRSQEDSTYYWKELRRTMEICYGNNPPRWLRRAFRRGSRPLMKYANILSFNVRVLVLFCSLVFNVVWFYFVFEITVLNLLLLYMVFRHERLCACLLEKLEQEQCPGEPEIPEP